MSDPLRHDESALLFETGRNTRIEELLLAGLDHYFKGQHELAINVWTRVLFLDRSHARARAYIERARGAVAERQREGEELLQTGAAAFQRGDAAGARRLLTSAVERGAPPEEALALLDRLDRLALVGEPVATGRETTVPRRGVTPGASHKTGTRAITLLLVLAIGLALGALVMIYWNASVPITVARGSGAQVTRIRHIDPPLPIPPASEVSLTRAHALFTQGKLREAVAALESIRPGDALQPQADELRILIQHRLLGTVGAKGPASTVSTPSLR